MHYGLDGKAILVAGGGTALGRHLAGVLAGWGARILVTDHDTGAACAAAEDVLARGGEVMVAEFDPGLHDAHEAVVARAVDRWGRLDGAVNTVDQGGPLYQRFRSRRDGACWEQTGTIQLSGLWFAIRAQAAQMREQVGGGGSIVNLVPPARRNRKDPSAPNAREVAKILALSRTAAHEFADEGLRVNAVGIAHPAADGPLAPATMPGGLVSETGAMVAWLLSDAATFMTGAAVPAKLSPRAA